MCPPGYEEAPPTRATSIGNLSDGCWLHLRPHRRLRLHPPQHPLRAPTDSPRPAPTADRASAPTRANGSSRPPLTRFSAGQPSCRRGKRLLQRAAMVRETRAALGATASDPVQRRGGVALGRACRRWRRAWRFHSISLVKVEASNAAAAAAAARSAGPSSLEIAASMAANASVGDAASTTGVDASSATPKSKAAGSGDACGTRLTTLAGDASRKTPSSNWATTRRPTIGAASNAFSKEDLSKAPFRTSAVTHSRAASLGALRLVVEPRYEGDARSITDVASFRASPASSTERRRRRPTHFVEPWLLPWRRSRQ